MVRRGRDSRKEQLWREVIRRQARSGLTIRGFCKEEGLSEAGFHWRRRELARRRRTLARRRRTLVRPRRRRSAATFVPLTVTSLGPVPAYEVLLRSGVRVLVHPSAGEKLADVLAALESR